MPELTRKDRDAYRRTLLRTEHVLSVYEKRYEEHDELQKLIAIGRNLLEGSRLLLTEIDRKDTEAPSPEVGDIDEEWRQLGEAA